jgi:uroporphyrinogen-III synthase
VALTVLVTRPAAQADEWVARLRAQGVDARALPLIAIEPVSDAAPLHAAWQSLQACALAMFVSPNAVTGFFAARPTRAAWPEALRAGATGPGSVEALVAAGVPRGRCVAPEAAPFDSAALWQRLRGEDWRGREVLIVRGDGGRDEFAAALRDAGAAVRFVQAYARRAPSWSAEQVALARAAAIDAPARHLWLLSSGEALEHLAALLPGADWSRASAIASHPRIALRARGLGFGRVVEAAPTLPALLEGIASVESSPP